MHAVQRIIRTVATCYALLCTILAVFLGELAFRPQRMPLREQQSAKAIAARFGADLQDVSLNARDGVQLRGWFASPSNANGDAVILLHGVGDNREGITVVNPTQAHMKITPLRLVIDGVDWEVIRLAFHLKSNDRERYDRISVVGNDKQDYNLHFLFPATKIPQGLTGELWLTSSNREDEPFAVPVSFA